MSVQSLSSGSRRLAVLCLMLLLVAATLMPQPAVAQSGVKETSSLSFVPDDVAFYASSMRTKEQYEALVNSKAFAAFKEISTIKEVWSLADMQLNSPFGPMAFFNDPNNQDLVDLLADMFSNEIFCYGDVEYANLALLMAELNSANRFGQLESQLSGGAADPTENISMMLRTLNENRDDLKIPGTLIGFKVTDSDRAKAQLKNLEGFAMLMLGQNPDLADRFQSTKIGGDDFLTLKLDGEMIPWQEVPIAELEQQPGEFDELVAAIKQMTLTVTLGVRGDHLLLALGADSSVIEELSGQSLLYDRTELAPLRKQAEERITGVTYLSREFAQKMNQTEQQIDELVGLVESLMPAIPFEDSVKDELRRDLDSLREKIKPYLPQPGAQMGYSYLNGRGYEGYWYNWSKQSLLDGSQKLTLLNHVGGDPVMYFTARSKYDPSQTELLVNILKRGFYYGDKFAVDQMDGEDLEQYQSYRDALLPYAGRLKKITTEKLIPSLQDGQMALVFDAQAKSKQWFILQPAATKALPMLEIALVYGVSDAALLKSAFSDYFTVAQELLDTLHEKTPEEIPEIKIPPVANEESNDGTISYFTMFGMLGLDSQLNPNAGLSDDVAVLSLTPGQTRRLLASTAPPAKDGPLGDRDRSLATAARCNWPAFVDALLPWVEYVVLLNSGGGPLSGPEAESTDSNPETEKELEQIRTAAKILKCYRGYSSVSYNQEKALVTHHESVFEDLK